MNDMGLTFNPKQLEAIMKASKEKLTIIHGPPGTGKTSLVAGIACYWKDMFPQDKILLLAPSSQAAELCCEKLHEIPKFKKIVVFALSEAN